MQLQGNPRIKKRTILLLAVIVFTFLTAAFSCNYINKDSTVPQTVVADTAPKKEQNPTLLYGIAIDSLNIIKGHVRQNRFLSDIVEEFGITPKEVDKIVKSSSAIFDVRDIRAGHEYTLITGNESIPRLRYFIYEHDPSLLYIFSFNDSINITPFRYRTRSVIKYASVVIKSSLWEAMIDGGINPEVAVELSDIFAWTVDFFGLQKGDRFRVIYEERYIGEKSVGIGRIYGAEYTGAGIRVPAIPLIQDEKESYYDAEGNSLRKAFLKSPLRFSRISSRYSAGRMHPVLRIVRPHLGVDYAAPVGTPVYSIGDGKVISAGIEGESGRIVRIRHNSVYSTAYLHLSGFGNGVYAGATVRQGDIIGYVGSSGMSTGPHLDFRFFKNGYPVDPLKVEAPAVEPVKEENRERFEKIKSVTLGLLETIQ
jgi:murein DD-endopeptidase MepM/ murein hydrolase activator NlpD